MPHQRDGFGSTLSRQLSLAVPQSPTESFVTGVLKWPKGNGSSPGPRRGLAAVLHLTVSSQRRRARLL